MDNLGSHPNNFICITWRQEKASEPGVNRCRQRQNSKQSGTESNPRPWRCEAAALKNGYKTSHVFYMTQKPVDLLNDANERLEKALRGD